MALLDVLSTWIYKGTNSNLNGEKLSERRCLWSRGCHASPPPMAFFHYRTEKRRNWGKETELVKGGERWGKNEGCTERSSPDTRLFSRPGGDSGPLSLILSPGCLIPSVSESGIDRPTESFPVLSTLPGGELHHGRKLVGGGSQSRVCISMERMKLSIDMRKKTATGKRTTNPWSKK